ncbi:MAG: hypothetical protein U1E53_25710 [Dongiaceae bacterium]
MKKLTATLLGAGALLLSACQPPTPVVDTQGVDPARYQADLADCQRYANSVNPTNETVRSGAIGALGGAALGAALGAIAGRPGLGAAAGATVGAGAGVGVGAASSTSEQDRIVRNCMAGRGYRVLN